MAKSQPTGWTDELLLREIRAGGRRRNTAWEYIYKAWRGYYLSPVLHVGGTPEHVDEVLGAVVIDVEKQVMKENFELRVASLRTYFTEGIVRAWSRSREIAQRRQTVDLDTRTYTPGSKIVWRRTSFDKSACKDLMHCSQSLEKNVVPF